MALQKKENILFAALLTTVLATLPSVITENIDCKGKAFYCVNSTHFKICVDLGGGVSKTVDDFLIPCPRNTACKDDNYFECEYQITTALPSIWQSDVTNDATTASDVSILETIEYTTSYPEYHSNKLEELKNDDNLTLITTELSYEVIPKDNVIGSFASLDIATEQVNLSSVNKFTTTSTSDFVSENTAVSGTQPLDFGPSTNTDKFATTTDKVILNHDVTNDTLFKDDSNMFLNLGLDKNNITQSYTIAEYNNYSYILNNANPVNNKQNDTIIFSHESSNSSPIKETNVNVSATKNNHINKTSELNSFSSNVSNNFNQDNISVQSSSLASIFVTTTNTNIDNEQAPSLGNITQTSEAQPSSEYSYTESTTDLYQTETFMMPETYTEVTFEDQSFLGTNIIDVITTTDKNVIDGEQKNSSNIHFNTPPQFINELGLNTHNNVTIENTTTFNYHNVKLNDNVSTQMTTDTYSQESTLKRNNIESTQIKNKDIGHTTTSLGLDPLINSEKLYESEAFSALVVTEAKPLVGIENQEWSTSTNLPDLDITTTTGTNRIDKNDIPNNVNNFISTPTNNISQEINYNSLSIQTSTSLYITEHNTFVSPEEIISYPITRTFDIDYTTEITTDKSMPKEELNTSMNTSKTGTDLNSTTILYNTNSSTSTPLSYKTQQTSENMINLSRIEGSLTNNNTAKTVNESEIFSDNYITNPYKVEISTMTYTSVSATDPVTLPESNLIPDSTYFNSQQSTVKPPYEDITSNYYIKENFSDPIDVKETKNEISTKLIDTVYKRVEDTTQISVPTISTLESSSLKMFSQTLGPKNLSSAYSELYFTTKTPSISDPKKQNHSTISNSSEIYLTDSIGADQSRNIINMSNLTEEISSPVINNSLSTKQDHFSELSLSSDVGVSENISFNTINQELQPLHYEIKHVEQTIYTESPITSLLNSNTSSDSYISNLTAIDHQVESIKINSSNKNSHNYSSGAEIDNGHLINNTNAENDKVMNSSKTFTDNNEARIKNYTYIEGDFSNMVEIDFVNTSFPETNASESKPLEYLQYLTTQSSLNTVTEPSNNNFDTLLFENFEDSTKSSSNVDFVTLKNNNKLFYTEVTVPTDRTVTPELNDKKESRVIDKAKTDFVNNTSPNIKNQASTSNFLTTSINSNQEIKNNNTLVPKDNLNNINTTVGQRENTINQTQSLNNFLNKFNNSSLETQSDLVMNNSMFKNILTKSDKSAVQLSLFNTKANFSLSKANQSFTFDDLKIQNDPQIIPLLKNNSKQRLELVKPDMNKKDEKASFSSSINNIYINDQNVMSNIIKAEYTFTLPIMESNNVSTSYKSIQSNNKTENSEQIQISSVTKPTFSIFKVNNEYPQFLSTFTTTVKNAFIILNKENISETQHINMKSSINNNNILARTAKYNNITDIHNIDVKNNFEKLSDDTFKNYSALVNTSSVFDLNKRIVNASELQHTKIKNNLDMNTMSTNNYNTSLLEKQNINKSADSLSYLSYSNQLQQISSQTERSLSGNSSNILDGDNRKSGNRYTVSDLATEVTPTTLLMEDKITALQFNCINRQRGKYSDENNCNKFYICIGKHEPIVGMCPVNTVFSEIKKQCTKNLSHCIRNNEFKCLYAGRFIDILSEEFYYICIKKQDGYIRYKLQCQKGYYLNRENIQCTVSSGSPEDSSKNISDKSTNESRTAESTQLSSNDKEFECVKEGKYEFPDDCRKYYLCTKRNKEFRRKIKKCDSDEVFNKEKRKCVDVDSYEC